ASRRLISRRAIFSGQWTSYPDRGRASPGAYIKTTCVTSYPCDLPPSTTACWSSWRGQDAKAVDQPSTWSGSWRPLGRPESDCCVIAARQAPTPRMGRGRLHRRLRDGQAAHSSVTAYSAPGLPTPSGYAVGLLLSCLLAGVHVVRHRFVCEVYTKTGASNAQRTLKTGACYGPCCNCVWRHWLSRTSGRPSVAK